MRTKARRTGDERGREGERDGGEDRQVASDFLRLEMKTRRREGRAGVLSASLAVSRLAVSLPQSCQSRLLFYLHVLPSSPGTTRDASQGEESGGGREVDSLFALPRAVGVLGVV